MTGPGEVEGDGGTADPLEADREVARALRRTWDPFFARFGRLTGVQSATIPHVLRGADVLVCAPTASGKTEAVCAPLLERRLLGARALDAETILYVSPTRALVNDLHERLGRPMTQLGLRLDRRTGEYRPSGRGVPDVLLTTPESLDSMLCRGRTQNGHSLGRVTAVVLDEVHLLHGTARGAQVQWLLARLERMRQQGAELGWAHARPIQLVALSATLPDAEGVRDAFVPGGTIVRVTGARSLEVVWPSVQNDVQRALLEYLAVEGARREKLLVFADSRRRVDDLAYTLRGELSSIGMKVLAHHGSLSKGERESAEETMRGEGGVVMVATSTMEIGVDIGDIDLVVLDGPPPDVSALLQRVGRGNRRTSVTRVMPLCRTAADRLILEAMLHAAREGSLGAPGQGPHYGVVRQQIASYVLQSPSSTRPREHLAAFLRGRVEVGIADALLSQMESSRELIGDGSGRVGLGEVWRERSGSGEIHSTIVRSTGDVLVDERTGRQIVGGFAFDGSSSVMTAGRTYEVRGMEGRSVLVRVATSDSAGVPGIHYRGAGLADNSGQVLAVRQHLGLYDGCWPVIRRGRWVVAFHLSGSGPATILWLAANGVAPDVHVTPWAVAVACDREGQAPDFAWLRRMTEASVERALLRNLSSAEHRLQRPATNKYLPERVRLDEAAAWLRLQETVPKLVTSVWDEEKGRELAAPLGTLLPRVGLRTSISRDPEDE